MKAIIGLLAAPFMMVGALAYVVFLGLKVGWGLAEAYVQAN